MADSPQHVAIIMDGNGRWARSHGLPRPAGHRASVKVVRKTVEDCTPRERRFDKTSAQLAMQANA